MRPHQRRQKAPVMLGYPSEDSATVLAVLGNRTFGLPTRTVCIQPEEWLTGESPKQQAPESLMVVLGITPKQFSRIFKDASSMSCGIPEKCTEPSCRLCIVLVSPDERILFCQMRYLFPPDFCNMVGGATAET